MNLFGNENRGITRCAGVREKIVARKEGWLSAAEEAAFDAHIAECSDCRKEMEIDARICAVLDTVAERDVPAPAWARVASKAGTSQRRLPRWLLVPALGAAAASVALLWLTTVTPIRSPSHAPAASTETIAAAASDAHLLMAASQVGADPNRAIVAWVSSNGAR